MLWAASIRASLTVSSATPFSRRVSLTSRTSSNRTSDTSRWSGLSPVVGACGASGPTVSVRAPVSPAWLEAVISTLPSDLATATQQLITCSTATVSGSLEVTVYAAPLGPITRPLRSPTSSTAPL